MHSHVEQIYQTNDRFWFAQSLFKIDCQKETSAVERVKIVISVHVNERKMKGPLCRDSQQQTVAGDSLHVQWIPSAAG